MHHGLAADFAAEVLDDLYTYRRKNTGKAWLLWGTLGWVGAHRFYLERPGTGALMVLSLGGGFIWWVLDAWRIPRMVREYNELQGKREQLGLPPLELSFMPVRDADVLHEPPAWLVRWRLRSRFSRAMRFLGDLLVLLIAGLVLGGLADREGGTEAALAVIVLIGLVMLGGHASRLADLPVGGALLRWSHRLRLYYYFNQPGSPPALMVRGITGFFLAPFRVRDRAEVRIYLELGAAFTAVFMVLDLFQDVLIPLFTTDGLGALSPIRLALMWLGEVLTTFLVTYAFAAPVGAVLTLYLLTRPTHTLPRVLGVLTLLFIAMGAGII